jgi:ubiquinone/menaquinone biosynthesis C-methylase UbiE
LIYFDAAAEAYDRREADNPIMQMMRKRSLETLDATFPNGSRLLDVGCGTGTEAIWLGQRGRAVFAVDSSSRMLELLATRASSAGLSVPTRLLGAGDLFTLADELGDASFDGAYSSFGALNTEVAVEPPIAMLARLVRPGGKVVLGVMNRWCVAEMAVLAATGRVRQALRRTRRSLRVGAGPNSIEVSYPSWRRLRLALGQGFRVVSLEALPLLLLPYAWPALSSHPRTYRTLRRLDQSLAHRRPFAWLGDHLLVVAERSGLT